MLSPGTLSAGLPSKDDSRPSPPLRASPANSYTAGHPPSAQVGSHNTLWSTAVCLFQAKSEPAQHGFGIIAHRAADEEAQRAQGSVLTQSSN